MVYRPLRDLADVLRRGGVSNVQEIDGWQDRGRPPSTGDFDPHGILCHHTASPDSWGDADDIRVILAGNSEAPGPISQLYVSRHEPWPVYVLAAGRANHGGKGDIGFGCADMNAALVGIEAGQSGSTHWPDGMIEAYGRTVAALMRGYGWEPSNVHLHHTTGPQCGNFKVDPSGPWLRQPELPLDNPGASQWDLNTWRSYCAEWLGSAPEGDDMAYVIYESIDEGGNRWAWADFMGLEANGITESVVWLSGDYKAQVQQAANPPLAVKRRGPGGYRTMRIEGPMPQGDQQYSWAAGDFRGP